MVRQAIRVHATRRWMQRVRCAAASIAVAVALGAGHAATAAALGAQRITKVPTRFRSVAHQSTVLAAGDYRFIGKDQIGASPDGPNTGVLTNVVTGASRDITAPAGCGIAEMSATVIVIGGCPSGSAASMYVEDLATGVVTPIDQPGLPGSVGRDWLEIYDYFGDSDYLSTATIGYVSLGTGALTPPFETIGSNQYADLNSPTLNHTACAPIAISAALEPQVGDLVPGDLTFVGELAIHSGPSDHIGAQVCGSKIIRHYRAQKLAFGDRIVVWTDAGKVEGIYASKDLTFELARTTKSRHRGIFSVQVNKRWVYIETDAGNVFETKVPTLKTLEAAAALRQAQRLYHPTSEPVPRSRGTPVRR